MEGIKDNHSLVRSYIPAAGRDGKECHRTKLAMKNGKLIYSGRIPSSTDWSIYRSFRGVLARSAERVDD